MAPDDVAIIIAKLAKVEQELRDFKDSHERMATERQDNLKALIANVDTKLSGFVNGCLGFKNKARIDTLYIWITIVTFFVILLLAIHGIKIDFLSFLPH